MTRLRAALVPAVTVVAVALTGACSAPWGGPRASAGDVLVTPLTAPGQAGSVVVPSGRLDLTLGEPEDEAPEGAEERRAPDGGTFVPVGWTWHREDMLPGVFDKPGEALRPKVELWVAGQRYRLDEEMLSDGAEPPAFDESGTAWVAVGDLDDDEHALDDARVVVTFDGVEQVWEPGRSLRSSDNPASDLYGAAGNGLGRTMIDCGQARAGAGFTPRENSSFCLIDLVRTPWYPEVGWSRDGEPWVVAHLKISAGPGATRRSTGRMVSFGPKAPAPGTDFTLAGKKPVKIFPATEGQWGSGSAIGDTLVFASGTGELELAGTFHASERSGGGAYVVDVPMRWTARIR